MRCGRLPSRSDVNISMILRVHIHGDALIPHTHTYRYYADRPRDPTSVPKAVLSAQSRPFSSPDGGNRAGMCRVKRPVDGNWGCRNL